MIEKEDIEKYLKKGGFLFELECIQKFESVGFMIEPGLHYFDNNTQQYREVDFIAYQSFYDSTNNFTFNINMVVECKAHIPPILAVSSKSRLENKHITHNLISSKNANRLLRNIDKLTGSELFTFGLTPDEATYQNVLAYSSKESEKKDRVFEAMMQSLNASTFLRDESNKSDRRFSNIYIPVVIFDNNLFSIKQGKSVIETYEVDYLKASKFYAFNPLNPYVIFHIVSGKKLNNYCQTVFNDINKFLEWNRSSIDYIIKNNPNNSGRGQYDIR
jgi:hypothetical protein